MVAPKGAERLIVALDLPADDAIRLATELGDSVQTFKVGWEMFVSGEWIRVIQALGERQFFVDLKLPGDIPNTISRVVEKCMNMPVKFITLSEGVKPPTIRIATAARGSSPVPMFLAVTLFSSVDEADFTEIYGLDGSQMNDFVVEQSRIKIEAGCDGLIASGKQIGVVRKAFQSAVIVSPGIRPQGYPADDQKRVATPTEALEMGADYLVVGRPITRDNRPRDAAKRIIDEINRFDSRSSTASGQGSTGPALGLCAKPA